MHILILNWRDPKNPKSGGAELVTMEHAQAWVKAGHTVTWLTSLFPKAKEEEVINGVRILRKGSALSVYLLAPFFYFFSKNRFDVVIDEIHGVPFFTPLYVKKPKIAFIHEVAGEIWDYMYPFPINVVGKWMEGHYFKLYKHIPFWTDAPSTIDELVEKGIPRENCAAIPCPINNVTLSGLPEKEKKPTFIFVSRLVKMKGIENVLTAFASIYKEDTLSKLWIVGGGEENYVKKLQDMVKDLGLEKSVVFWGRVSEEQKLKLLRKAHILLHASVKEGWGLVVLEAASQATPAVVYNVEGLRDVVKDGKTGVVLSDNTPEEMARQSLLFLGNRKRYKRYQESALQWVRSLTWSQVTKESEALLQA